MASTTSVEANKELVRRIYYEFMNVWNEDLIREFYESDIVVHNVPGGGGELSGLDALGEYFKGLRETFPDLEATVNKMIAEDDLVAVSNTYTGTHEGEFMGATGTGETVTFDGLVFFRIGDGKVAETWGLIDNLGLMRQLGVTEIPAV